MPILNSTAVVASPAGAAETVVAQVAGVSPRGPGQPVLLVATVDITTGATGTGLTLVWRRGPLVTSPLLGSYGPELTTAATRYVRNFAFVDQTEPDAAGLTYSFDLTIGGASGASTVNAVSVTAAWGF